MKESQWRTPGTARTHGASVGVLTLRPRPSALDDWTSHPRPPFKLNDHSQVRPRLPAYVARSSVIGTLPANDRVAMVTVPGGVGMLMADDASGRGLAVPPMPEAAQRRMLELAPFAAARNPIDVNGQFLNDPSLLDQVIELPATSGDYGSLVSFQGSIGRNPALMEATLTSWIERKRANPDKHFAVSGFCTEDYTRDLEAVGHRDPPRQRPGGDGHGLGWGRSADGGRHERAGVRRCRKHRRHREPRQQPRPRTPSDTSWRWRREAEFHEERGNREASGCSLFHQLGVYRAESIEEFFDVA